MNARRAAHITGLMLLVSLAVHSFAPCAFAAWPNDPSINVPVTTAAGDQFYAVSVPDGAGGAIIAWVDYRTGAADIYAQRISSAGVALWTANGVPVCTATGDQLGVTIVSDGAGGAIFTWQDSRLGAASDIYAQRADMNGTMLWLGGGVVICSATGTQANPKITTDGSGGAIIAWEDQRGASTDVYARRITSSGTTLWVTNGNAVCTAADAQDNIVLAPDAAGGVFIAWQDARTGTDYDVYLQHVNSAGTMLGSANGQNATSPTGYQVRPALIADGAGGVILAWSDARSGAGYDIYAQHFNPGFSYMWGTSGRAICSATSDQYNVALCTDGNGGAFVAWEDYRGGDANIYLQRMSASGVALLSVDGVALTTSTANQYNVHVESDRAGGALLCWDDIRSSSYFDTYAQRVSASGASLWTSGGLAVLAAPGSQWGSSLVSDGAGGGIFVSMDVRLSTSTDIYCQRVERYGQLGQPEPAITGVKDVRNDQGGFVKVSWSASYLDTDPTFGITDYRLWRSVPSALAARQALTRGATDDADAAARDGALLVTASGYAWELAGSQTADALPSYSLVTATLSDSLPGSFPRTAFMIEARASNSISSDRWYSAPDSGYSVDNIAPAAPAPLTGQYLAGLTRLHWNPNAEADLAGYRLYRGSSTAFVPSPASFVADLPDTGYADAAGAPYVYKLRAVDLHGNESPVATLVPSGTLGVEGGVAPRTFLSLASANPSRGTSTTLRFGLATAGPTNLAIYDASGRRVRTLLAGALEAGEHAAHWDGRDDDGHVVAAGLYFAKLQAAGSTRTLRIVRAR